MSTKLNPTLQIDPEFESKIPPLTEDEYRQLEENIISEGIVLMPLIVWNGTIVDGHNRYKIVQEHPEIIFTVHEKDFDNRYEALVWICNNQLGRRNLTPVQKKMLIGERYDAEKKAIGGDRKSETAKSSGQFGPVISDHATRARIASETGTSESFVKRASQFSQGATAAEEVSPGFRQEVLSGKVKPTQKEMQAIAKAAPEERKQLTEAILHPPDKDKSGAKPVADGKRMKGAIAAIEKISEDMAKPKPRMTAQDAVQQFEWKVTRVLQTFDNTFDEWPQLISNESYRQQVISTLYDLKQYILHIEGGTRYEWDQNARKIAL